jgi:TonB family protein
MHRLLFTFSILIELGGLGYGQRADDLGGCPSTAQNIPKPVSELIRPHYPPAAQAVHAIGDVVVVVSVDPSGKVTKAFVQSGHPLLKAAAEDAAAKTAFEPSDAKCQRAVAVTYTFLPGPPDRFEQPVSSPYHALVYAYEGHQPRLRGCSDPRLLTDDDKAPTLSVPEAIELEDCLDGKVVRVYGIYSRGFEGSVLTDLKDTKVAWLSTVQFSPVVRKCTSSAAFSVFKSSDGATFGIVALGILRTREGMLGFGHMNSFDEEFDVLCFDEIRQFSTTTAIYDAQPLSVQKIMSSWYNKAR